MRKLIAVGVVAVCLALTACGAGSGDPESPVTTMQTTSAPVTTTAEPAKSPAAWSVSDYSSDSSMVAVVGDVVLTPRETAMVALNRKSGKELWHGERSGGDYNTYWISGPLVVLVDKPQNNSGPYLFEVIDIASGSTRWQASADEVSVFDKAVYTSDCQQASGRKEKCATMRRDLRDGKSTWTAPATGKVSEAEIGLGSQQATIERPYVAFSVPSPPSDIQWALLETATGTVLPVRAKNRAWYEIAVENSLIVTDNSDVRGEGACPVSVEAFDGHSGTTKYSTTVNSGRRKDGECEHSLGPTPGDGFTGSGSRVAAVSDDGSVQLLDLVTGNVVWTSEIKGTALDADDRSLLISEHADQGSLTLVDMTTGQRKWTVADPGFIGYPSERTTFVVGDRVVVGGRVLVGEYSAPPVTLVYDRETGRELSRYDADLAGAGADWVAIGRSVAEKYVLEFHG
ncbi:PQQ-binding-like beta-propeller repeat protein [Nocardia sp. NPDC058666]|uniref:outer membrane protein assembly factor BamB family protein n=1 Tax=Nocardia sp. NPDC058666 TaxID=3346587 RepID=UPI00364B21A2